MTKTNMDLSEFLSKHDQGDLLRSITEAVKLMMEADVGGLIGAGGPRSNIGTAVVARYASETGSQIAEFCRFASATIS